MSDTFNFSGNFQGAILNVKSTLNNTTQSIGAISNATPSDKEELTKLVNQLSEQLQQAPPEKLAEAEKIAKRADELIKEATEKDVDKEAVEAKGNLLLKAAQNVAAALPTVLSVSQQIISHISKLF